MVIKNNLGSLVVSSTKGNVNKNPFQILQVGKVYGVITTLNTPNEKLYEQYGGEAAAGIIFYLDYNLTKTTTIDSVDLNSLPTAKPLFPYLQYTPLEGELVYIIDLPSPADQLTEISSQKYYVSVVNVWNTFQQNTLLSQQNEVIPGFATTDIPKLIPNIGDFILEGRKGSSVRFSDGIIKLTNVRKDKVEDIDKDSSSIYFTSNQTISLTPDKSVLNYITRPKAVNKYNNSQLLANADRIVLNSKKDEVMVFAKTNIEFNTRNVINLNADKYVHINSPKVILGEATAVNPVNPQGEKYYQFPSEPMLLGGVTQEVLTQLCTELSNLARALSTAVSAPPGSPSIDLNAAGNSMLKTLEEVIPKLKNITSKNHFLS